MDPSDARAARTRSLSDPGPAPAVRPLRGRGHSVRHGGGAGARLANDQGRRIVSGRPGAPAGVVQLTFAFRRPAPSLYATTLKFRIANVSITAPNPSRIAASGIGHSKGLRPESLGRERSSPVRGAEGEGIGERGEGRGAQGGARPAWAGRVGRLDVRMGGGRGGEERGGGGPAGAQASRSKSSGSD